MEQLFTTIQYRLKDKSVQTLIDYLEERKVFQYNDFFLFEREAMLKRFDENLEALTSPITITQDFFEETKSQIISMTIDGDYVVANNNQTFIIEKTLIKADIETYEMSAIDFFVAYENGQIQTNILPTVLPDSTEEPEIVEPPEATEKKKSFFDKLFGK